MLTDERVADRWHHDTDITGSSWPAMIKNGQELLIVFLSHEAQYPKVLNRTHRLHVLFPMHMFRKRYNINIFNEMAHSKRLKNLPLPKSNSVTFPLFEFLFLESYQLTF